MAQVCTVIQADPNTLAAELNILASTEEILHVVKTKSAGKFLVISDNAASTSQVAAVIVGDPDKLSAELAAVIALPATIDLVSDTFSAAHYVVVYK